MKQFTFTIFVPVYNGEKTLDRVFKSIKSQTYKNFEVIIINDGSTDNSDFIIRQFINEGGGNKYTYINEKQNRGKHSIWNKAISIAKGEFFIPADCDDSFVPDTLEFYNTKLNELDTVLFSKISGINVCCYNPDNGEIIGDKYPKDGMLSDNIELAYKYKIKGEHWGTIKTDLLRMYKFPQVSGHYYTESFLWFSLALNNYKVVCFNNALRCYYTEATSLTHSKKHRIDKNNIKMSIHYSLWVLRNVAPAIFKYDKLIYFKQASKIVKLMIKLTMSYFKLK